MDRSDIYAVIASTKCRNNKSQEKFNWYSFIAIMIFVSAGLAAIAYLMGI